MKLEDFEKLTDLWSYNDIVCFIMEDSKWCDAIMQFIRDNWNNDNEIELGELNAFGKAHDYPEQTQLDLEE
jgi:hypothetical protein